MTEVLKYVCPTCGREARVGRPCPGCVRKSGKPKKRSWKQDPAAEGLDLPDDDFNYQDFVAREFGKAPHRALGISWYWWALAVALLVGMISGLLAL